MSTRLFPRHVPTPARGLAASHRELRQAQAALRVAVSSATCPPAGHAFWSLLANAAAGFEGAVARHLRGESTHLAQLLPRLDRCRQLELEEEHTSLAVMAVGLSHQVANATAGDERAWPGLRAAALRLIEATGRHLEVEERLVAHRTAVVPQRPMMLQTRVQVRDTRDQSPSIA